MLDDDIASEGIQVRCSITVCKIIVFGAIEVALGRMLSIQVA